MSFFWIAVLVLVVTSAVVVITYTSATLNKLPMLDGEEILFEEAGVHVTQSGTLKGTLFVKCKVRVTNRRIITSQKLPLRDTYALSHVVTYDGVVSKVDMRKTIGSGFITADVSRQDISVEVDTGRASVIIPLKGLPLTHTLRIFTRQPEKYRKVLGT